MDESSASAVRVIANNRLQGLLQLVADRGHRIHRKSGQDQKVVLNRHYCFVRCGFVCCKNRETMKKICQQIVQNICEKDQKFKTHQIVHSRRECFRMRPPDEDRSLTRCRRTRSRSPPELFPSSPLPTFRRLFPFVVQLKNFLPEIIT